MLGTIQVDLDGIWAYRRHMKKGDGIPCPAGEPVYEEGVKNFLELFDRFKIKATFFVVGADLKINANRDVVKKIITAGHEIANHSMNHLSRFSALSRKEKEDEITQCAEEIKSLTGKEPAGFRAPVFSIDEECLSLLEEKKYLYDASVVPSFISPLLMKMSHSLLRGNFFDPCSGSFEYAKAPREAYYPDNSCIWKQVPSRGIIEIPVSVSPVLRFPIHSTYAFLLGRRFFEAVFEKLRKRAVSVAYLFHGIDLVDLNRHSLKLPFYAPLKKRKEICEFIIGKFDECLELLTTEQIAGRIK